MSNASIEAMLGGMTTPNRDICSREIGEHDKHMWALCQYIKAGIKRRKFRGPGEAVLSEMLSTGHTVAVCLWTKYHDMDPREFLS